LPTVSDHIRAALQLIGAASAIKPASPEVNSAALDKYNSLVARWVEDGIEVGAVQTDVPGNESQVYSWARDALEYSLAIDIAAPLQVVPSPVVVNRHSELLYTMTRRARLSAVDPTRSKSDERLPLGSGNVRGVKNARRFTG
jgi:hypothetical protein